MAVVVRPRRWRARPSWSPAATGGIGKATAIGLAALGARVAITGRDLCAPRQPRPTSMRRPATRMSTRSPPTCRRRPRSVAWPQRCSTRTRAWTSWSTMSADSGRRAMSPPTGWSTRSRVNHLAAFLLTDLLLDRLKASAPARVVTVSSGAHRMGRIDFDDLQGERQYSGRGLQPVEAGQRHVHLRVGPPTGGTGVTATVLHPGVVSTGFGAEDHR